MPRWLAMAVLVGLSAATASCSRGPKRVPVAGTVSYDGKTVDEGWVAFHPADDSGPPDGGPVKGGRFSFQATPGRKVVRLIGQRDVKGTANPMRNGEPNKEEYLPDVYNAKSTLTAEVPEGGKDDFDFTLPKPPK